MVDVSVERALEFRRRRYPAPAVVSGEAMIGSAQKILIPGGYGTFGRRLAQLPPMTCG
jgi:hypothetical protein